MLNILPTRKKPFLLKKLLEKKRRLILGPRALVNRVREVAEKKSLPRIRVQGVVLLAESSANRHQVSFKLRKGGARGVTFFAASCEKGKTANPVLPAK